MDPRNSVLDWIEIPMGRGNFCMFSGPLKSIAVTSVLYLNSVPMQCRISRGQPMCQKPPQFIEPFR